MNDIQPKPVAINFSQYYVLNTVWRNSPCHSLIDIKDSSLKKLHQRGLLYYTSDEGYWLSDEGKLAMDYFGAHHAVQKVWG